MKYVYEFLIIIIIGFTMFSCDIFVAGSYPYVESYEIPLSEDILIKAINNFKEKNPEYIVPDSLHFVDHKDTTKWDLWYHVYFYYKDEDQIINTWTRPRTKNSTTFGFVSVCEDKKKWVWKRINKDFDSDENEEQKKKFEERILKKIFPAPLRWICNSEK